ncbi:MAG: 5'/3'-nucleotidase SurE [Actinomycetota bacterium]|nr:5'/3'-nucleotidase SurE [Actinomycetota bacterium]
MRILVTNDDGVRAPGIAALARAAIETGHEVVVVAPMVNHSGAGAAVGPVHSRGGVDYEGHVLAELPDVAAFGIDGPPALAVILACVGGFGARPDLVLSGINDGANVGRSVLHSGTVGAALTAAHFGLRSLAVSIRYGSDPVPWETPAALASALVPALVDAPAGTVLNLNVPDVALDELLGIRHGHLGRSGAIRSAVLDGSSTFDTGTALISEPGPPSGAYHGSGPEPGSRPRPHVALPPMDGGTLRLDLAPPARGSATDDLSTDSALVANGYASLTALVGVHEADGAHVPAIEPFVEAAQTAIRALQAPAT